MLIHGVTVAFRCFKVLSDIRCNTMTPVQSRMARAALGWRTADVADVAQVSRVTVARFELGQTMAADTVSAIRAAYEAHGVILIADGESSQRGGVGVRLRGAVS